MPPLVIGTLTWTWSSMPLPESMRGPQPIAHVSVPVPVPDAISQPMLVGGVACKLGRALRNVHEIKASIASATRVGRGRSSGAA